MRIVMTLMVRDEADIVGAMLAHHRASGIDHVVVTDNASIDGTLEVLHEFEREGFATLWHDPEHRKQQFQVVTRMARFAATDLGADWVVNADADEFLMPTGDDGIRDALAAVPSDVSVIEVPVVNLTGPPARAGSGLDRLILRDHRPADRLSATGIPFHPTPNAIHRAHPEVEVAQGNHRAEAPHWAPPVTVDSLEVLHLPWRSWRQYEHKVRVSGEAYLANPDLAPSPRHHGMLDFRRLQHGRLESAYVAKHPSEAETETGLADGSFVIEPRLRGLSRAPGVVPDLKYEAAELASLHELGRKFRDVELQGEREIQRIQQWHDLAVEQRDHLEIENRRLNAELDAIRNRFAVRFADRFHRSPRRATHRGGASADS